MAKFKVSDEDKKLFREAMHGTRPLGSKKNIPQPSPRISVQNDQEPEELFQFSDTETLEPVGSEDTIEYQRTGLQHKIIRNLRRGQYNVEAILDLHGMTVDQAREALGRFLNRCRNQGIRHVLMIHGKGHGTKIPVLKNKLNHWLRQTDSVLAFCSATPRQGRGGALYVLLKKETLR